MKQKLLHLCFYWYYDDSMTSLSGADETLVIGESVLNVSEEVVRHFLMPLFMRRLLATTPSLLKFKSSYTVRGMSTRLLLFEEVCSTDFLSFSFGGRGYSDQLTDAIAKTGELAGARVELLQVPGAQPVVWVSHNFGFLGGSLGCAEGEKITRAFEYGLEHQLPVVVQCRSGGARMQEGTSSLMQMAKISVAVDALRRASLPFVAVLSDPTYGGVSASYAMQADIKIAVEDARIGFAGPQVILNTMCDADQGVFDSQCPPDFQSAAYVLEHGQLDIVLKGDQSKQAHIEQYVTSICTTLLRNKSSSSSTSLRTSIISSLDIPETDKSTPFNYTRSRKIDRPQTQDIIGSLFDDFVELSGDSRVGRDCCIRGGIATFDNVSCVVLGTFKGHTPTQMQEANYGMASPHGYRTALRLMRLAEQFNMPVVTLVDTVGAWPTFECERDGQSEAIATNLTAMAGLKVPIVTIIVGEGGSGGALGIGMGNVVGMLSGGYFGVISPEGAASILGRYKDDAHKAQQFPLDCQELATAQCIYAHQLQEIGVVDVIIWEGGEGESYTSFPLLRSRVQHFLASSLASLGALTTEQIIKQRYDKFRGLGTYLQLSEGERSSTVEAARKASAKQAGRLASPNTSASLLVQHLATEVVTGAWSKYRKLAPPNCPNDPPVVPTLSTVVRPVQWTSAKRVLDAEGPEAVSAWVKAQHRVLLTDTTMRDAHQSLFATRARTDDLVKGAVIANELLKDCFSFEAWGGATFDVCMRFLDECPWERLREIRKACPDVCLQMLIRGANAVGYTSYPDNVVAEFVRLAAVNGMDVFRIFDCFNDIESMRVSIDAVRANNKVAEVCLCYTGEVLTSPIYNLDYYKSVAKAAADAGAHIIGIKDMSGLLRPLEAGPLLAAIRQVTDLPIHFHTHATSSGSIATCYEMARHNCDIIDFCTASMADGTSQPSMNVFCAMMKGAPNDTGIDFLTLEPYDMYWARVRDMYSPFESGMKSGSARVYEHQIPGGQYSNLIVQCQSMGLWSRWEEVLDAYRDVNRLFGDIIKVTPSSKCVGDLALYLVTCNVKAQDVLDPLKAKDIDFPESVVGLLKGDLGFPHRGFPLPVEEAILKGETKRTQRAGVMLAPVDFVQNLITLTTRWCSEAEGFPGETISAEQAMSSLMYPKVFDDYMKRRRGKGRALRYLPTPVYFYAMSPGQKFNMLVPAEILVDVTKTAATSPDQVNVSIELIRVCPLKEGKRKVIFSVNGIEQHFDVKDTSGAFIFEGEMADPKVIDQVGSPMPGLVEKLLVVSGQKVAAGDTLCTISAMKMEVKVTAPRSGTVALVSVSLAARVVEGALLITII